MEAEKEWTKGRKNSVWCDKSQENFPVFLGERNGQLSHAAEK